jgi:hypothetical protein
MISLFKDRAQINDKEYGKSKLLPYELRLIRREKLDSVYKELIETAVSPFRPLHPCLILILSPATLREMRGNGASLNTSRKRRMFYMGRMHKIE